MMTQEQMEVEIVKLKIANNEIKDTISEMQHELKKTVGLLDLVAVLIASRK